MVNNVIRSVAVMLLGLVLILMSESAMGLLIRLVGAAFFLPALVSIVNLYVPRSENKHGLFSKILITIINVGSMAFGVWLMVAPGDFEDTFIKLLAILLVAFALYQLIMVVAAQRHTTVPVPMYIAPMVLIVLAVILFSVENLSRPTCSILFGIGALVAGISDLVISLKLKGNSKKMIDNSNKGAVQKY